MAAGVKTQLAVSPQLQPWSIQPMTLLTFRRTWGLTGCIPVLLIYWGSMVLGSGRRVCAMIAGRRGEIKKGGWLGLCWQNVYFFPGSGTGWLPLASRQRLQLPLGSTAPQTAFSALRVSAWKRKVCALSWLVPRIVSGVMLRWFLSINARRISTVDLLSFKWFWNHCEWKRQCWAAMLTIMVLPTLVVG